MKISVGLEHIAGGVQKSRDCCPIALALNEQAGGSWRVGPVVSFSPEGGWVLEPYTAEKDGEQRVRLCRRASEFARSFDMGFMVFPFEFELPLEG